MTTATRNYPTNRAPWLIILALIFLATIAIPETLPKLYPNHPDHPESNLIRKCAANKDNIQQIWINSTLERFNCLVKLPDGRLGNVVATWCRITGEVVVTAYMIGDGSLAETIRVLRAKACTQVWP